MQANLLLNEQLQELVESAFSAMLSLPVCHASPPAAEGAVPLLAASVAIAGTYNGTVLFTCTEQFGRRAASILLGVEPAEVTLSDIHDTVAELSNIFGGGIKSILPGPSNLSLPSVAHGCQLHVHVPRTVQVSQIEWSCENQPLSLQVLEAVSA